MNRDLAGGFPPRSQLNASSLGLQPELSSPRFLDDRRPWHLALSVLPLHHLSLTPLYESRCLSFLSKKKWLTSDAEKQIPSRSEHGERWVAPLKISTEISYITCFDHVVSSKRPPISPWGRQSGGRPQRPWWTSSGCVSAIF